MQHLSDRIFFYTKNHQTKVLHMNKYTQLTLNERNKIYEGVKMGKGIRHIAKELERAPSTVSREIRRHSDHIGYLYPRDGHAQAFSRKARYGSKIDRVPGLRGYIIEKLHLFWSPVAIAGRWSKEQPPFSITPETIYRFIYSKENLQLKLWEILPRRKRKRGIKRKRRSICTIEQRVSINERPNHIAQRDEPGHFEADLFFNKGNMSANSLTLVERKSRMILLVKHNSKKSDPIIGSVGRSVGSFAKSVTFDNGKEFAMHYKLNPNGIKTFFCDPGKPWQKGSVEHANGLLRRFVPFKLPAYLIKQNTLDRVAGIINNIPRKSLGFLTPLEVFKKEFQSEIFKCCTS